MSVPSAEIAAMTAQMKLLTDGMRNLVAAQSHSVRDSYVYSDAIRKASYSLEDLEKEFKKQNTTNRSVLRSQQELLKAKQDEIALMRKLKLEQKEAAKLRKEEREALAKFTAAIGTAGEAAAQVELDNARAKRTANVKEMLQTRGNLKSITAEIERATNALQGFGGSLGGASKGLSIFGGILSVIGGSLIAYNKTFMDATTKSGGVIEQTMGSFDASMNSWILQFDAATGIASGKVLEMMAQNRQMVNSVGGMREAIDLTEDSIMSMRGYYGTLEESMKANLDILSKFAVKGIAPTQEALQEYNKDLDILIKQTGLAPAALNSMIDSIAGDTDSLSILKAAREEERESILASQRAILKNNIALGMSAEQASEAAKMLGKMVAQKPLERYKQAAKMRVLGTVMGLGPESEKAAVAVMKGKRASKEEKEDLNNFNIAATGKMDTAAQQGFAQELFMSTLLDKLDMNEYYGSSSPFSATLGDQLAKSQESVKEMYQSSSDSTIVAINNTADIALHTLETLINGTTIWAAMLMGIEELVTSLGGLSGIWEATSDAIMSVSKSVLGVGEDFVAGFQDLIAKLQNVSEAILHPVETVKSFFGMEPDPNTVVPHADTDHRAKLAEKRDRRKADDEYNAKVKQFQKEEKETKYKETKATIKTPEQVEASADKKADANRAKQEQEQKKQAREAARVRMREEGLTNEQILLKEAERDKLEAEFKENKRLQELKNKAINDEIEATAAERKRQDNIDWVKEKFGPTPEAIPVPKEEPKVEVESKVVIPKEELKPEVPAKTVAEIKPSMLEDLKPVTVVDLTPKTIDQIKPVPVAAPKVPEPKDTDKKEPIIPKTLSVDLADPEKMAQEMARLIREGNRQDSEHENTAKTLQDFSSKLETMVAANDGTLTDVTLLDKFSANIKTGFNDIVTAIPKPQNETVQDTMLDAILSGQSVFQVAMESVQALFKQNTDARPVVPNEAEAKNLTTDRVKEAEEKSKANKAESYMINQLTQSIATNNKIDEQLKNMSTSNEYLKVIAETNPKILDIAEKQLAVSTMTQEQRDKVSSRLSSESAKFNADYSYSQ